MADAEAKLRISAENRTQQAFGEIRRGIRDIDGASNALRGTLASLGVGLSLGGLAAFAKSGIDAADNLGKLSQRVGVTVESLSALQYAAKLSDVSVEQLSTGLRQLAKNATDTQAGTGGAVEAFRALGIAVTGTGGQLKSTEDLLLDVAERFSGIEDGAGKTALAMRLFGESGAQLLPLLNQGRSGFEALRLEAARLGVIISTETAKAAEQFNDDLTRLSATVDGLKYALGRELLPTLTNITAELLAAQRAAGSFSGGIFLSLTTQTADAGRELNHLSGTLEKLKQQREDLAKPTVANRINNALFSDLEDTDKQIAAVERRITFLKDLQRQEALAMGGGDTPGERARMGRGGGGLAAAPALAGRGGGAVESQFQRILQQLQDESTKVQELTRFEQTLASIEAGRYGKLSELQRNRLLEQAAAVDLAREDARVQKEAEAAVEEAQRRADERGRTEAERLNALARQYRDLIDPIEQFRRKLAEVDDLAARGLLSQDEATAIKFEIELDIEEANGQLKDFRDEVKRTDDASRELGLTMTSALGKIITEGGKAKDVMRALLQDIAQIVIRRQVLDPIGKGISGVLDGIFGGARALGGPVAAGVPYLVGERGPELFVPQASGNIVPNNAMSGMGGATIVQNIQFSANTPAASRDAVLAMLPMIKQQTVAAVQDQRNRTGDRR
jgi:hypothetical protein